MSSALPYLHVYLLLPLVQDGLDCAIIFDGTSFKLETLGGQMKTKWVQFRPVKS